MGSKQDLDLLYAVFMIVCIVLLGIADYKKQKKEKKLKPGSNTFFFILFVWITLIITSKILPKFFVLVILATIILFRFKPKNNKTKSK